MVAEVIIDLKNKQVNQTYDYLIPDHFSGLIEIGQRVTVSFGKTKRCAFVVGIKEDTTYNSKLKEIEEIIDDKRILDEEFIELASYISKNYFNYYASVLDAMIPRAFKYKYEKIFVLNHKENLPTSMTRLFRSGKLKLKSVPVDLIKDFYKEVASGNLSIETNIKRNINDKVIEYVKLENELYHTKNRMELSLIEYLKEMKEPIEKEIILNDLGYSINIINNLVYNKVISIIEEEINFKDDDIQIIDDNYELTSEQLKCYEALEYNKHDTYLLFGVTGSGKTEIYMRWITKILDVGKEAIILVPEISLTPQMSSVFKKRFGNLVSVLHSRLTPKEKYEEWKKIIAGSIKIVVGARSAIFAPLKNLGIIIVDEEHDKSFIQINNPKYDGKDVALWRSKRHNIPLVLASATPTVVDYYHAINKDYKLLVMKKRVNGTNLEKSEIIDLKEELKKGNRSVFSKRLKDEILKNHENHEQTILFLNRRGFSSFVMCRSCGHEITCPHCDVTLTYHKNSNILSCHQCGFFIPNVATCPNCGSDKIRYVGTGTEKIYEETKKLVPDARIIRVDTDNVKTIEEYNSYYEKFRNNEADILVGTQMITKGLDFPNVTLVGILNASLSLKYPSYDASEVTYELIEQASGRAGRKDKKGRCIIQTYHPENYAIVSASIHDYEEFFNAEIKKRKLQNMPPYSLVYEINIISTDDDLAKLEASNVLTSLKLKQKESIIYGPLKEKIFKINDEYRYKITVFIKEEELLKAIEDIYPLYQQNKNVRLDIRRL